MLKKFLRPFGATASKVGTGFEAVAFYRFPDGSSLMQVTEGFPRYRRETVIQKNPGKLARKALEALREVAKTRAQNRVTIPWERFDKLFAR